jgi:DNA repair protein RecN (Recombination protein N)
MIDELHVSNLALIRDATFTPAEGLTVVTGETGAGKTALLSALKLVAGERADAGVIREGQPAAQVEARFILDDEADRALADAFGDTTEDGCHVAVRKVSSDGRSRVSIDGGLSTVRQLSQTIGATVDLCGQHEHQMLLKPANHVRLLDAWIGGEAAEAKEAYAQAFDRAQAAAEHLEEVRAASQASGAQLDEARFVLQRIDEVNPTEGEYEELIEDLPRFENAEDLARAAEAAYEGIASDSGALTQVNDAARALEDMAGVDAQLSGPAQALREVSYSLEDVAREVRQYRDGIEFDPEALSQMQDRVGALQGLMRTWGPRMEDVFAAREKAQAIVSAVDDSQEVLRRAQEELDRAEAELADAAAELDRVREEAAPRFSELVNAQLARLEMSDARLTCSVEMLPREKWTHGGADEVEFLYQAAKGLTPRPLARIASGGEISRVMLACKVVLGSADTRPTLVFDEVDAGVGGSAAVALASVLADLARTHQVIVVSHLAQVAVRAQRHYVVTKERAGDDGIPETHVRVVEGDERVAEVARMLSGDANEATLAHAREMLDEAAAYRSL